MYQLIIPKFKADEGIGANWSFTSSRVTKSELFGTFIIGLVTVALNFNVALFPVRPRVGVDLQLVALGDVALHGGVVAADDTHGVQRLPAGIYERFFF